MLPVEETLAFLFPHKADAELCALCSKLKCNCPEVADCCSANVGVLKITKLLINLQIIISVARTNTLSLTNAVYVLNIPVRNSMQNYLS
jgi:hypothetical protein